MRKCWWPAYSPCQCFQNTLSSVLKKIISITFNPNPLDKILNQTKLKAFAVDKLKITKMIISVFDRVENSVGKGEIAFASNFSFSHNVFKRLLSQTRQNVSFCGNGLTAQCSLLLTLQKKPLKTLSEKKKIPVTCIFSFLHNERKIPI